MLFFKPIQIEDKEAITAYTFPGNFINCDYAFTNMCSWRFLYDSEYTIRDGFLISHRFTQRSRICCHPRTRKRYLARRGD